MSTTDAMAPSTVAELNPDVADGDGDGGTVLARIYRTRFTASCIMVSAVVIVRALA